MENQELTEEIVAHIRKYKWSLLLGIMGILLLASAFFTQTSTPKEEIQFQAATESSPEKTPEGTVIIDIAGAVLRPGVYELPKNARLTDGIQKAGGLSPDAHTGYVAKQLNLAESITDGMKIYIPFAGEETGQVAGMSEDGKISINNATQAELESLPAVGVQTAAKIIKLRPYRSLQELISKKAVSNSVFQKISSDISL